MISEIEWLVGVGISLTALVGGVIVRDRQVLKAIADGDNDLHRRVNDVKERYVRRDDLNARVQGIENLVSLMREEQQATNRRIDELLALLAKRD